MLFTFGALSSAITVGLWRMLWPVSISMPAIGASAVEERLAGASLGQSSTIPTMPVAGAVSFLTATASHSAVQSLTVPGNSRIVSASFFDRSRDLSQHFTHAFNLPSATVGFAILERICSRRTHCAWWARGSNWYIRGQGARAGRPVGIRRQVGAPPTPHAR